MIFLHYIEEKIFFDFLKKSIAIYFNICIIILVRQFNIKRTELTTMRKNYTRIITKKINNNFKVFLDKYNFNYKICFSIKGVKYNILATEQEISLIDYYIKSCELCNM